MTGDKKPLPASLQPTGITAVLSAMLASDPASAVVPVVPADTIEGIAERVRAARARSVQLLVPEGVTALQGRRSFMALRLLLQRDGIGLLVISPDAKVVEAARAGGLETMEIGEAPHARQTHAAPSAIDTARARETAPASTAIDERDAAFLRALDEVPGREQYDELSESDAAFAASLDDFSDAVARVTPPEPQEEAAAPSTAPRPRRVSAADVQLSPEEEMRVTARDTARRSEAPARRRTASRDTARGTARAPAAQARQASTRTLVGVAVAVLVVAALIAIGWYITNRVSVIVGPPVARSESQPFRNEIVPITTADPGANAGSIQAAVVVAEASYTVEGRVSSEIIAPAGRASGQVRIINVIEQAFPLPVGTELLGTNPAGAEVRFALDDAVTVPPAITTVSDRGRSTTYGEIVVNVSARSPGSASNVEKDALTQLLIPGQQPIVSGRSNLIIRHEAIGGGTEEPQRIVTEADVQQVLGAALTGLYQEGMQQLSRQIDQNVLTIDPTTITPGTIELARPEAYDPPLVEPPIGQPVDRANPVFRLTVRTRFSALATPRDRLVSKQLELVVPQYFIQRGAACRPAERAGFDVAGWRWDGSKLMIDGAVTCTEYGTLTPEALNQVRQALTGASRSEAETILQQLVEQGVISSYSLPAIETLPDFGFLIDVQAAGAT